MSVQRDVFGQMASGQPIERFTLRNRHGLSAQVMTFGATLLGVETPDRIGRFANITLHLDTCQQYLAGHPCLGSTCGRYANRIARGRFTLDGVEYRLTTNEGPNHLHGGRVGFDKVLWEAELLEEPGADGVRLVYTSPDGEEGYPGTLRASVTYRLTDENELQLDYTAQTDKPTVVNLTNHAYWNLAGAGTALDHELTLYADHYLPVDAALIPLGEVAPVAGTPMDFTSPRTIRSRIAEVAPGYDHCYVLRPGSQGSLVPCAQVYEPSTGRTMEVWTTEPGVQFYTGNHLDVRCGDRSYRRHDGFCLECQHFPDSPNHPNFPSTVLRPGQTYWQRTVHRFGVR